MIGAWTINVGGRHYGPFSSERMRNFAGEGRLAPHSLVARENSDDWHEARDEPEFADLFAGAGFTASVTQDAQDAGATAARGTASYSPIVTKDILPNGTPSGQNGLAAYASIGGRNAAENDTTPAASKPKAPQADAPEVKVAHFAIVIDMKSRAPGNLEEAIASLGPAYRLLPNVWIVSTEQTVNAVRNRLVQELGRTDTLFVVDASRGKAAWFNFGPEADVRIRRVWQKAS